MTDLWTWITPEVMEQATGLPHWLTKDGKMTDKQPEDECCGRDCKTPYCPYCGKKTKTNPLKQLLRFVTAQAKGRRKYANRISGVSKVENSLPEIESAREQACRWEEWEAELRLAIDAIETGWKRVTIDESVNL